MKNILILSLLALGLVGCETYGDRANRVPYRGYGEYGFTYDLDSAPSPFDDTSYRPLTPYDLAAPIIVVVTNQPPERIVYEQKPLIEETRYPVETPVQANPVVVYPTIIESAGAPANLPASKAVQAVGDAPTPPTLGETPETKFQTNQLSEPVTTPTIETDSALSNPNPGPPPVQPQDPQAPVRRPPAQRPGVQAPPASTP